MIASYGFFGGAYGSLPDAAIWWCLRTGGGGVVMREAIVPCNNQHTKALKVNQNKYLEGSH